MSLIAVRMILDVPWIQVALGENTDPKIREILPSLVCVPESPDIVINVPISMLQLVIRMTEMLLAAPANGLDWNIVYVKNCGEKISRGFRALGIPRTPWFETVMKSTETSVWNAPFTKIAEMDKFGEFCDETLFCNENEKL
jgi:hypothetical protein